VETTVGATNAAARTAFLPLAEDQLGRLNNLVEEGQTFPQVAQF